MPEAILISIMSCIVFTLIVMASSIGRTGHFKIQGTHFNLHWRPPRKDYIPAEGKLSVITSLRK
jgi:hypothetical protein